MARDPSRGVIRVALRVIGPSRGAQSIMEVGIKPRAVAASCELCAVSNAASGCGTLSDGFATAKTCTCPCALASFFSASARAAKKGSSAALLLGYEYPRRDFLMGDCSIRVSDRCAALIDANILFCK